MIKNFTDKIVIGEKLDCPVCGKEFKVTSDTCYVANGGYVCSWKCFLGHTVYNKKSNEEPIVKNEEFQNNISETIISDKEEVVKVNKKNIHNQKTTESKKVKSENNISEIIISNTKKRRGRPRKEQNGK